MPNKLTTPEQFRAAVPVLTALINDTPSGTLRNMLVECVNHCDATVAAYEKQARFLAHYSPVPQQCNDVYTTEQEREIMRERLHNIFGNLQPHS